MFRPAVIKADGPSDESLRRDSNKGVACPRALCTKFPYLYARDP
jgi:hypothetical protein